MPAGCSTFPNRSPAENAACPDAQVMRWRRHHNCAIAASKAQSNPAGSIGRPKHHREAGFLLSR